MVKDWGEDGMMQLIKYYQNFVVSPSGLSALKGLLLIFPRSNALHWNANHEAPPQILAGGSASVKIISR
ncbi:hypothetical protein PL8927_900010 [Planktothrix serta PCC 8927]|uniref:Uncharacterized protein n=1 Tax=Planktothrix serta PCC 8927 TaxID=671068 RepID=A0A7Z9E573_9CYAN|nr:hypothetical protein PL8927_900010 [Planktothrix serta PCC 8927]